MDAADATPHALHPSRRDAAGRAEYWASLALRCCPHLGPARSKRILEAFGTAEKALAALASWHDLGVPARVVALMKGEAWREAARGHWDALKGRPDGVLLWSDAAYPEWLRHIADPPPLLYFRGNLDLLSNVCVAVVGMRNCTTEGLRTTAHIGRGLSDAGITIVSGMAVGIDRAAHLAGLEGPGSSIGVLGTGLAVPYPRENLDLHALMRARGLLVSEFAPEAPGRGGHFLVRNRLISGLSRAVLVTEAAMRSGSLNTARHALEQNRELMAVPGPASSEASRGCQALVRGGAKPVFEADDVVRELVPWLRGHVREALEKRDQQAGVHAGGKASGNGKPSPEPAAGPSRTPSPAFPLALEPGLLPWKGGAALSPAPQGASAPGSARRSPENSPDLDDHDRKVLEFLHGKNWHMDDICRHLGQSSAMVSRRLLLLEMRGLVRRLPGMVYGQSTNEMS